MTNSELREAIARWDRNLMPITMEELIEVAKRWLAVQEAITDEGPAPFYHRQIMKRHKEEWPTLWAALDQ